MVLLEKKIIKSHDNLKNLSYLYLKNEYEILLFECPSIMYGSNFRPPTFDSPQKKLKFKIPRLENVDRIFVTSSESLGILFLKQDLDIYLTLPVYEQILSNYYSLMKLQLTYDDELEDENIMCIDEVDINRLKRNVRLITYNELIHINDITIECKPSGMFIGWCTFLYKTSSKIFHITNKLTNKKKYAIEYKDIKADFEVNLNCVKQQPNPIEEFNEKVLYVKDKSLIIACDIPTLGIELMFHLLFVFKNVPLKVPFCVKYEKFNEYFNNLCNHTEWMGQIIKTNPFSSNLIIIEDIQDVKTPSIVFIDSLYVYEFNSNNYDILTVGEIMSNSFFMKDNLKNCHGFMFLDVYHFPKDSLINDKIYSVNLEGETTNVTLKNTLNDYDGEYFYLSGCMKNTDKNTPNIISKSIDNFNTSILTGLFENSVYFYHEGSYFFPEYDLKICEREDKTFQIIKF